MTERKPVSVEDVDGDVIEVSADHCGMVRLRIPGRVVDLDETKQEEFAQAYIAKCHEAKALAEAERRAEQVPGRVAVGDLHEMLGRAAMPGQVSNET